MPLRRDRHACLLNRIALISALPILLGSALIACAQTAVTTQHNDNYRTGWNANESVLTAANVNPTQFGLLATTAIDDQVDAQPLIIPGVRITAGNYQGQHDVAYVVSENDTVYAIDANSGTVLLSQNLGTPVTWPLSCNNNGPHVGINSTPVIDMAGKTMYVIVYTSDTTGPAYRLHALDLGNLTDKIAPQLITATNTLTDGTTYAFNATYQRQRSSLLLANDNVYAGFASFCDYSAQFSRGWLLGWNAATLAPLSANRLNDTQATSPDDFFLSSIWMSGNGVAADDGGNILFVTGNSDYSGTTYDGVTNIQESVVKVPADLTSVLDLFTPSNQASLDQGDTDFGSGGVMILPDQPGSTPHLAVAAGKYGTMFLMNEDKLGGYSTVKDHVLGEYNIGNCWCSESYFVDPSDGLARVVSSGGNRVEVRRLQTSPKPALIGVARSAPLSTGQNPGFFTSVSSNGTSNPIIWALTRPVSPTNIINLYAFNPEAGSNMKPLLRLDAGNWPYLQGDSNQVPVVANGKVYVTSYKGFQIFGLKTKK
jgi:hypothetical protein